MGVIRCIQEVRHLSERRGKGSWTEESRREMRWVGVGVVSNVGVEPVNLEKRIKKGEVWDKVRLKWRGG